MNLASNPTTSQLSGLLAPLDDTAGHHIVWVGNDGTVHIDLLPDDMMPPAFVEQLPNLKFRLETLCCGNGYTGPEAAADDEWVSELYGSLTHRWERGDDGYLG